MLLEKCFSEYCPYWKANQCHAGSHRPLGSWIRSPRAHHAGPSGTTATPRFRTGVVASARSSGSCQLDSCTAANCAHRLHSLANIVGCATGRSDGNSRMTKEAQGTEKMTHSHPFDHQRVC